VTQLKKEKEVDAYTQHVMSNIPSEVFNTLNLLQIQAIESAIGKNAPFRKHPMDIRGTISLFFIRFYFVLLIGRDRRYTSREKEGRRRQKARSVGVIFAIYSVICIIAPIIFLILYLLKSLVGIDLFPDSHLIDMASAIS
jgi:ABC-type Fe3+ transport system permease subunit